MKGVVFTVLCFLSLSGMAEDVMNQSTMEAIVKALAVESKGEGGMVKFTYQGVDMYLVSDVTHDRMRIISPIDEYDKLSKAQIDRAMESNFHSALDARYALSKGWLYAAYIHPLSKLDSVQIESAVTQVFNLRATFGSDYSSGVLSYGGH